MHVTEYHRPSDLATVRRLLARERVTSVPLAGGTSLVPALAGAKVDAVVDLADLPLNYLEVRDDGLHLGATVTLAMIDRESVAGTWAGGLLARAAAWEGPLNLRNAATVGGLLAQPAGTSAFYLALLALGAHLILLDDEHGAQQVSLAVFADAPQTWLNGRLILEAVVPASRALARHGLATVGRTPQDWPILAAVAVKEAAAASAVVALGGAIAQPLILSGLETLAGRPAELEAAVAELVAKQTLLADFRGSADYRRAIAPVLVRRAVLEALSDV